MLDDAHGAHTPEAVLAEAAAVARHAPSVHNTQPWQWLTEPQALELRADRSRQLRAADPEGRLLTISCGAALHHARLALAAAGWTPAVERFPDASQPDHLARVRLGARAPATAQHRRLREALDLRHTDRRPTLDSPVPAGALELIREAAGQEGAGLHRLTDGNLDDLAAAAAKANQVGLSDPDQRAELEYWVGGRRLARTGIPAEAVPDVSPQTDVPGRDFGRPGTLSVGTGHARTAEYAILFRPGDEPEDWLRAGEALSALWLKATDLGVAVLPLSSVIEVPATREVLRRMLAGTGQPMLVLRLGLADTQQAPPAQTPRLPTERVLRPGRFPQA